MIDSKENLSNQIQFTGENQYDSQSEDSKEFLNVKNAFQVFNFSQDEERAILNIIAVILHMGQTGFLEDNGQAVIAKYQPLQSICRLLQCDERHLKQAFTSKSIEVRGMRLKKEFRLKIIETN